VGVRSTADGSAVSLGLEGSSVEVNGEIDLRWNYCHNELRR